MHLSMKLNWKGFLKKALYLLLFSILLTGIGYLIAMVISHFGNIKMGNVLCYEGLAVLILGLFMSMKGNPNGVNLNVMGAGNNSQYIAQMNVDVTAEEQKITNYHENFKRNGVVEFCFSNITICLAGILLLVLSAIV